MLRNNLRTKMTNAKNLMMKLEIELEQFKNCTVSYEKEVSSSVSNLFYIFRDKETRRPKQFRQISTHGKRSTAQLPKTLIVKCACTPKSSVSRVLIRRLGMQGACLIKNNNFWTKIRWECKQKSIFMRSKFTSAKRPSIQPKTWWKTSILLVCS